jgi:hypothetical protein
MVVIIADILSLAQHLELLKNEPEQYRPQSCIHCGRANVWCHGCRYRKADRGNNYLASSLNPIKILRFYCSVCGHTCSVLPECIPPHRWYLWDIQQAVLLLVLSGYCINKISQSLSPSRWTCRRWVERLTEQFNLHAFHLKTKWSWLGNYFSLQTFWSTCLERMRLSSAMLFLNEANVSIP